MPAVVEPLDPARELPVDPGKEAVARFSVRNTGADVNNFMFHVLGEPNWWPTGVRVVGDAGGEKKTKDGPPKLDLGPNEKGEVEVIFRPPETSPPPAGLVPYGFLVCSHELKNGEPEEKVEVVQEGLLNVGRFHKRNAQLIPRTSRGRLVGRHRLAVDNFGNWPSTATFAAEDAENQLHVRFRPRKLVIEPGTVAFTRVKVKPRRKFLLGPPRAAPFKLFIEFAGDAAPGPAVAPAPPQEILPVEGLYMQRGIIPPLLLPIGALAAAAVILWALFKPQPNGTAAQLGPAQAAAQARADVLKAINTSHRDAVLARKQVARSANLAHQDAKQTRQQAAKAASVARQDAKQTQKAATGATKVAARARTKATRAAQQAAKALQAATPAFGGTPYGQPLALPSRCAPSCTSPQPLTPQAFPAQTLYVTDLLVGNPGSGKGTLTLTLGGRPLLVEPLASVTSLHLKPSTPIVLGKGQSLALRASCTGDPCAPSVYVSGFYPAKAPDPKGPSGAPMWRRLASACRPAPACATFTVPAKASSYQVTDVVFQNPAGDTGAVSLLRGKQPLLVEGLDKSRPGDLTIALAAPIALKAGEKLSLGVSCKNAAGRPCTPAVLLNGVLRM
jgi:hypothetical protein